MENHESTDFQHQYTPVTYARPPDNEHHQRSIPVDLKLQQNKERRYIIDQIREREKQEILKKRKQKQENVQNVLKEKQKAKENAKILFENYRKTCNNRFQMENSPVKELEIQAKIEDCRLRATETKLNYQKKKKEVFESRHNRVKENQHELQSMNANKIEAYHLEEWKNYEQKLLQKHKGEKRSPRYLYDAFMKRENEIKEIVNRYKNQDKALKSVHADQKQNESRVQPGSKKEITSKKQICDSHMKSHWKDNPIISSGNLSHFGLSKSIKNPQKMMIKLIEYIENNKMSQEAEQQQILLDKFEQFLNGGLKL